MVQMLAPVAEEAIELALREAAAQGAADTRRVLEAVVGGIQLSGIPKGAARQAVRLGLIRSGKRKGIDLTAYAASLLR